MFTITDDRPARSDGGFLIFNALDADGPFEVWVEGFTWERWRAEAPFPADDADQRDHALMMIAAEAGDASPVTAPSGLRVLLL